MNTYLLRHSASKEMCSDFQRDGLAHANRIDNRDYINDRILAPEFSNLHHEDRSLHSSAEYPGNQYPVERSDINEGTMTVSQYACNETGYQRGAERSDQHATGGMFRGGLNGDQPSETQPQPGTPSVHHHQAFMSHQPVLADGIENIAPPGHHPFHHSTLEHAPSQHHRVHWPPDHPEGIPTAAFHFQPHFHEHFPFQGPYPGGYPHHQIIIGPNGKPKRRRVATVAQRRAANIRERRRMFNLNEAFDDLRKKVPTFAYEKRLSRIETLRLAITYISFMADLVEGKDPKEIKLLTLSRCNGPWGSGSSSKRTDSTEEEEETVRIANTGISDMDSHHEMDDLCEIRS